VRSSLSVDSTLCLQASTCLACHELARVPCAASAGTTPSQRPQLITHAFLEEFCTKLHCRDCFWSKNVVPMWKLKGRNKDKLLCICGFLICQMPAHISHGKASRHGNSSHSRKVLSLSEVNHQCRPLHPNKRPCKRDPNHSIWSSQLSHACLVIYISNTNLKNNKKVRTALCKIHA